MIKLIPVALALGLLMLGIDTPVGQHIILDPIISLTAPPPKAVTIKTVAPKPLPKLAAIKPAPVVTPVLAQYAAELGITVPAGLSMVYADTIPPAADLDVATTAAVYYDTTTTIYVKTGYTPWQTKNLLAYEFMHYVWDRLATPAQHNMINLEGDSLVQTSTKFQTELAPFLAPGNIAPDVQNDERDSIICTRLGVAELSDNANAYCSQYIPNRGEILP